VSNPLRTHVKKFLLYTFWEIGPSFINKYIVSVSIYERLAGVTSKLAQNEYTGPATTGELRDCFYWTLLGINKLGA